MRKKEKKTKFIATGFFKRISMKPNETATWPGPPPYG